MFEMTQQKYDQDPRNIIVIKLVKPMCPNVSCKSKNIIIRQVGELKINCCNVCGVSGTIFIDV